MDNSKNVDHHNVYSKQLNSKIVYHNFTILLSNIRNAYDGSEHPSKLWVHSVILHNNSMIILGDRHLMRSFQIFIL